MRIFADIPIYFVIAKDMLFCHEKLCVLLDFLHLPNWWVATAIALRAVAGISFSLKKKQISVSRV